MANQQKTSYRCTVIALAGGSGSGKTTLAQRIQEDLHESPVAILEHDSYYQDHSDLPFEQRARINYDHPDAFDHDLFQQQLEQLRGGQSIDCPVYNYKTHCREKATLRIDPSPVILIEGFLVLHHEIARAMMDLKIYVDCYADIRLARRLRRDCRERNRTYESVLEQYFQFVRPMHYEYVEPTRHFADLIVPNNREDTPNEAAIAILTGKIEQLMREHGG